MYLHCVTPSKICKFIDKLPSKDSSGYYNISNNFLKRIELAIILPLTKIFKLSLTTGKFPEKMKLSEVIPLFKGSQRPNGKLYTNIPTNYCL